MGLGSQVIEYIKYGRLVERVTPFLTGTEKFVIHAGVRTFGVVVVQGSFSYSLSHSISEPNKHRFLLARVALLFWFVIGTLSGRSRSFFFF